MLVIRIFWLQATLAMAQLPKLGDLLGGDNTAIQEPAGSEGGGLVPALTVVNDIIDALPDPTEILAGVIGAPVTTVSDEETVATSEPVPISTGEEVSTVEVPTPEPTPGSPVVQVPVPSPEVDQPAIEEPTPAPTLVPSPDATPAPAPAPIALVNPAPKQNESSESAPAPSPNVSPAPAPSPNPDSGAGGVALLPLPSPPTSQDNAPLTPVPAPAPTTNPQPPNTSPFPPLVTPAAGSPFMSVFVPPRPTQVGAVIADTDSTNTPVSNTPPSISDTTNPLTNTNISPDNNPLSNLPSPSPSAIPSTETPGIPLSTKIGVAAGLGGGSLILLIVVIYMMWHKRMGNNPFSRRGHKRSGSGASSSSSSSRRDLENGHGHGHHKNDNARLPVQERQKLDWESEHDVAFDFGFAKERGSVKKQSNYQETREEDRLPVEMEARMGVGKDGRAEFRR